MDEASFVPRFWSFVDVRSPAECWPWTGGRISSGYGSFSMAFGIHVLAHRLAYFLFYGPIPTGHHIDHVWARGCRRRECVNPSHLEAVTVAENNRRARAAQVTCRNGHPWTPETTYYQPNGNRRCRACAREGDRQRTGTPVRLASHRRASRQYREKRGA